MKPVTIYDGLTMKRLAYLQNAYDIQYGQYTNMLWTASFTMPYSDHKNNYCKSFNFVELWDINGGGKDKYVGLFRIMPQVEDSISIDGTIVYNLEHVLSTLLDDVMLGWNEIGNTGTYTNQSISYILNKQTTKRWILGECEHAHQFLYGWQDENLLSALYSIVEPFSENDFYWSFDTKSYPWRLNLKKINSTPITDVRYRKNLIGFKRTEDPSNLTTRLYCYGYGDGDNKLNIMNVNNGTPYIDSPNIAKYGVITQVWTDERFTIEESLKATGEAMLRKLEEPEITYEIDIQTINTTADLNIGDTIRVVNGTLDDRMVVQKFEKRDVSGAPKSGKILLGHGTKDVGSSIADLAERQRISETYSQGSESIFMDSLYDNADNANPMEATFTIPENAVHVNEIRFTANLTNFRAYSKATLGGGAMTQASSAGGATTQSSSSGGGGTQTSSSGGSGTQTSYSGGGNTISSESASSGGWGTLSVATDRAGGELTTSNGGGLGSGVTTSDGGGNTGSASGTGSHRHSVSSHTHNFGISSHTHTLNTAHQHIVPIPLVSHSHTIYLPSHSHNIYIPDHTHNLVIPDHTHTVTIPNHTHDITIPDHTHAIEYGIYRGPIASQMSIYLDDVLIGTYTSSVKDLNLVAYMAKNANGNVMRGEHTIKIEPSSLTRIECSYQIRMFTNARGGGQY